MQIEARIQTETNFFSWGDTSGTDPWMPTGTPWVPTGTPWVPTGTHHTTDIKRNAISGFFLGGEEGARTDVHIDKHKDKKIILKKNHARSLKFCMKL